MQVPLALMTAYRYVNALNSELKDSLIYYSGEGYDAMNRAMRRGYMLSEKDEKHYANIMRVFEGAPRVREAVTLYRGMGAQYKDDFQHPGVMSTSYNKEVAKKFAEEDCCIYVITITPGEYGVLPIQGISENKEEDEVLLPPGRLSVQSVVPWMAEGNEFYKEVVYCTYIPQNAILTDMSISPLPPTVREKLSTESWVERIVGMIKDTVETLCDDSEDFELCIREEIEAIEFYREIPNDAIEKAIALFSNVRESMNT
jgi:hypothetical protein